MPKSAAGHRVKLEWMGRKVETLSDLLRSNLDLVCVGINPALVSVAAGHYYQGALGQRIFRRLRTAGLIDASPDDWEDDIAFRNGIGFTDVIKRPTTNAASLLPQEYAYGRTLLEEKLRMVRPKLVLF